MDRFREKYGPWALITGASSGIGAEFARQIAARGLALALVARRGERLHELAKTLEEKHAIRTRIAVTDLAEEDFLPKLRSALDGIEIGLLVNNAGFGNIGNLLDSDLQQEVKLLHVNCRAPLMLAHEFGRPMKARGRGGIIFVSSFFGFAPVPHMGHYAASKAYDLFLGEAIAEELRGSGVDVMALCPGMTRTEFMEVANVDLGRLDRIRQSMMMNPEQVVGRALGKLGRRTTVIPGWQNVLMVLFGKFMPRRVSIRLAGLSVRRARKR